MRTDDIRQAFLDFFRSRGHTIVPSDSLVPKDDPTLLFTGAGMNQFKEKFLGRNITYRRAASSQKCLRTGDLDNVGRTSGHHTFFEMLGNFSFGDYFKKETIQWAWEFMTVMMKIPPAKLWASVYNDDEEAYDVWTDVIKMPGEKMVRFGEKENFWPSEAPSKGPNGPCGPSSEIFYDYGRTIGCGSPDCTPACGCGRFVEVWNLVFTQFDRQPDGSLKPLPARNIDTGMGLERIASVTQGVNTNFEIDIFRPLTGAIESGIGRRVAGSPGRRARINAIADHVRAAVFAIADGVMPSNEARGYVVRKLVRRSVSYAIDLGIKEPSLYKLAGIIAEVMAGPYPQLRTQRDDIAEVIKQEEENYLAVIQTQLPKVEEAFGELKKGRDAERLARTAFNFYDTYGMPYEMLEEAAERLGLEIDRRIFDRFLDEQRQRSRAKTKIKSEIFTETFAKKVEALGLKTEFIGYAQSRAESKVLAVLEGGGVILDKTPFYGESGGQAGDRGRIETGSGAMEVEDAKKIGEAIVHTGRMLRGKILKDEIANAAIDEAHRRETMANHTATHLLHAALRKVLGEHVRQIGSFVDNRHLRFDFTHVKKLDPREIARVEELVNDSVSKGIAVKVEIEDLDEARSRGAMALFDEKYGAKVRVVSVGEVSKELCGGTHVKNAGDIGIFKITGESSIASGARRIEALTGQPAKVWMAEQRTAEGKAVKAEEDGALEKKARALRLKEAIGKIDEILAKAKISGGVRFIAETAQGLDMEGLRALSDRIKEKAGSSIVIIASRCAGKASFVVNITGDLAARGLNAASIAKDLAGLIDGSGGGRDTFAQGGGRSPAKLDDAFVKIVEIIEERLK